MTKMHDCGEIKPYLHLLQCDKCKRVKLHKGTTQSIPHCIHCAEGER